MYKALPYCLEIRHSPVHGQGLFASEDIEAGVVLGVAWAGSRGGAGPWWRLPMGAFVNHAEPALSNTAAQHYARLEVTMLATTRRVARGEELFLSYTQYDPTKNQFFVAQKLKKNGNVHATNGH